MIARLSSSCKHFNVAHSKTADGINTKIGILAHHDKVQLHEKGHNYESCGFGVMPLVNVVLLFLVIALCYFSYFIGLS